MTAQAGERAVGRLHADTASLAAAAAAAGGDHVALVADGSVDRWHATVESAAGGSPRSSFLVSVDETVRGAAAAAAGGGAATADGRAVGGGVSLAAVEAPLPDPVEYVRSILTETVGDGEDGHEGGSVVADDLGALLPVDADVEAVVDDLVALAGEFGLEFHAAVAGDGATVSALARRLPGADDAADRALAEHLVDYLRDRDPTNFGYLRQHWREARAGLAAVSMTYPQSKQVHAAIPDPETTPRTLGAALQALVILGALDVWGDTVAANRYDLTGYDPARVDAVGAVLDALED
ncbi:hypothetical protein [Halobaculum sp. EA56]|uniref:hypothetical protein n=1 Tax=Halobaculum sp. EA56 TaxID=3421648 RepID=UPI003EBDCA97